MLQRMKRKFHHTRIVLNYVQRILSDVALRPS